MIIILVCVSILLILLLGRGIKKFWSLGISTIIATILVMVGVLATKYLLVALLSNQLTLTTDIQGIINTLFTAPLQNTITLGIGGMVLLMLSFITEQILKYIPSIEMMDAQVIDKPDNKN